MDIDDRLKAIKNGCRSVGIPDKLVQSIVTKAIRAPKRLTGAYRSNRESRWLLPEDHIYYATEVDCKLVCIKLLAGLFRFKNSPSPTDDLKVWMQPYFVIGEYRDPITDEEFDYLEYVNEQAMPVHGRSKFHIGHMNPKAIPKHVPDNIMWQTKLSNEIQGGMPLDRMTIIAQLLTLRDDSTHEQKIKVLSRFIPAICDRFHVAIEAVI